MSDNSIRTILEAILPERADAEELVGLFRNKIKIGNKWYVVKVNSREVDVASIDIVSYINTVVQKYKDEVDNKIAELKRTCMMIPKNVSLPEGVTIERGYIIINTIYNPTSLVQEDKVYLIKEGQITPRRIRIMCLMELHVNTLEGYLKPIRCLNEDGSRFIHYHSLSETDCTPELLFKNEKGFIEAIEKIKASYNVINRNSLGRKKPDGMPDIEDLGIYEQEVEGWL